jgi:uncharacterized BrkB/YihY/UPF0761 family membrane protein
VSDDRDDPGFGADPTLVETLRELSNAPSSSTRLGRARTSALATAESLTTRGTLGPLAELGWAVSRRLQRTGGSALAALLAYRMFVWLLPFALVVVFVVGLFYDGTIDSAGATEEFGLAGFVAASISSATAAAGGPSLVSGAIIGGLVLLYMTYALVRSLRATHALIWRTPLSRVPEPSRTTLIALAVLVGVVFGRSFVDGLADHVGLLLGAALTIASYLVIPVLWLLASLWLPHRVRNWQELIPGALFLTVVLTVIHALVVLVMYPYLRGKEETYGGLGLAAGIMLALYGIGYSIVAAAAINAELVDRRDAREAARARRLARRSEVHA